MCKENSKSNSIKNKKWEGNCSKKTEENKEKRWMLEIIIWQKKKINVKQENNRNKCKNRKWQKKYSKTNNL